MTANHKRATNFSVIFDHNYNRKSYTTFKEYLKHLVTTFSIGNVLVRILLNYSRKVEFL